MVALEVSVSHSGQSRDDPVHRGDELGPLVGSDQAAVIGLTVAVEPGTSEIVGIGFTWVVWALVLTTQVNPKATQNIYTSKHQHQNYNGWSRLISNRFIQPNFLKNVFQQYGYLTKNISDMYKSDQFKPVISRGLCCNQARQCRRHIKNKFLFEVVHYYHF